MTQTPHPDLFYQLGQHLGRPVGSSQAEKIVFYWTLGGLITKEEDKHGNIRIQDLPTREGLPPYRLLCQFYRAFPEWTEELTHLSWTHYKILLVLRNPEKREYYRCEALHNQWSTRELARQIQSLFMERQRSSLAWTSPGIKDPYVLEFLDLSDAAVYKEKDLEAALLLRLQDFLLELGKGFAFVARQKRLTTPTGKNFYIDLVFYHYLLKCFVLVDFKVGELTHRDIGQMDMYVRFFEEKWRGASDGPTLGLILCARKDETLVRYSMLADSEQLFASTYQFHLPTEIELAENIRLNRLHQ